MKLDYEDYITLLTGVYALKQRSSGHSIRMSRPTPSSLKKECLAVYEDRKMIGARDEAILKAFLQPLSGEGKTIPALIKKIDTSRFKPLQDLIQGEVRSPNQVTVELLAWLIDFRHRPFDRYKDVELNKEELEILDAKSKAKDPVKAAAIEEALRNQQKIETEDSDYAQSFPKEPDEAEGSNAVIAKLNHREKMETTETGESVQIESSSVGHTVVEGAWAKENSYPPDHSESLLQNLHVRKNINRPFVFTIAATLLVGGLYFFLHGQDSKSFGLADTACMYWVNDHYEQIPCSGDTKGQLKLALDPQKIQSFKRILREDTISERSVGQLFYIKRNNMLEYYTSAGKHPVETTRDLHRLTEYIYNKYLKPKKETKPNETLSLQKQNGL